MREMWRFNGPCALAAVLIASFALTIVPGVAGASTFSCPLGPNCGMSYYDGPVMHTQRIVLVDWGPDVPAWMTGSAYTPANYLSAGDPGYIRSLAALDGSTADIGGVLAQYADPLGSGGVGANAANDFTYVGQDEIANPTYGSGGASANVSDTEIQNQLDASIHDGTLPAPTSAESVQVGTSPTTGLRTTYGVTTLYVVLFPPNDTITQGGSDSVTGFCAYHNSFQSSYLANTDIAYAVMPSNSGNYDAYGGCGPDTSSNADINNETDVLGHEIGEAVTDPLIGLDTSANYAYPAGWGNNTNGEVGDVCATGTSQEQASAGPAGGQWISQALWSNLDNACATAEPSYAQPTAAITLPGDAQVHVAAGFSAAGSHDPSGDRIVSNHGLSLPSTIGPGLTSYEWNWGDGSSSSGVSPAHTYASPGSYAVTLTVTDALGFTGTTTKTVSVGTGTPVATTGSTSGVSGSTATLLGSVNPEGPSGVSYRFVYGTTPGALSSQTAATGLTASSSPQQVSASLSGLSSDTTYYYQLIASLSGVDYPGSVRSFTTGSRSITGPAPRVSTSAPSRRGMRTATLVGTINAEAHSISHHFEWGTAPGRLSHHTNTIAGPTGTVSRSVTSGLRGLLPNHVYYYRLVANSASSRYAGSTVRFRTRAQRPAVSLFRATAVHGSTAIVSGTVNPNGSRTRFYFEFGTSRNYAYSTRLLTLRAGDRARRIRLLIGSLHPGRHYRFRLVAFNAGGASFSRARSFRTGRARGRRASLRFSVPRGQTVGGTLARGLLVHYRCSARCQLQFSAVRAAGGGAVRAGAESIQVAVRHVRSRGTGARTVRLRLTAAGRRLLRHGGGQALTVIGVVIDSRSPTTVPVSRRAYLSSGR